MRTTTAIILSILLTGCASIPEQMAKTGISHADYSAGLLKPLIQITMEREGPFIYNIIGSTGTGTTEDDVKVAISKHVSAIHPGSKFHYESYSVKKTNYSDPVAASYGVRYNGFDVVAKIKVTE